MAGERLIATFDGRLTKADGDRRFSEIITAAHTFSTGDPLATVSGGGHVLASSDLGADPADCVCYNPGGSTTTYAAVYGEVTVPWTHGLGARALKLFLGVDVIVAATSQPQGVFIEQELGFILGPDLIRWRRGVPDILG